MCGRFRCVLSKTCLAKATHLSAEDIQDDTKYTQLENIPPGKGYSPVLIKDSENQLCLRFMKFGLIPSYTKPTEKPNFFRMFNARSETISERRAFRRLRKQRCVVLINGFYEWKKLDSKTKQPYYLYLDSDLETKDEAMYVAGIYDCWKMENGDDMDTFSLLTTTPCSSISWLHDRMPVILSSYEAAVKWLSDPNVFDNVELVLDRKTISNMLRFHPVTKQIGSSSYNEEDCSKEIDLKPQENIKSFFISPSKDKNEAKRVKVEPPAPKRMKLEDKVKKEVTEPSIKSTRAKQATKTKAPKLSKSQPTIDKFFAKK